MNISGQESTTLRSDGYEMAIGELVALWKSKELVIDFDARTWSLEKSRTYIEAILFGIPLGSIIVTSEINRGRWIVLDGIDKLIAILWFIGYVDEFTPFPIFDETSQKNMLFSDFHIREQIGFKRKRFKTNIIQPDTAKQESQARNYIDLIK